MLANLVKYFIYWGRCKSNFLKNLSSKIFATQKLGNFIIFLSQIRLIFGKFLGKFGNFGDLVNDWRTTPLFMS